jgi:predicted phage tail protein
MSIDRTARGIVLVPCLLLGGAFLSAAAWGSAEAAANRSLALVIGLVLLMGGALAQLIGRGRPPEAGISGERRPEP